MKSQYQFSFGTSPGARVGRYLLGAEIGRGFSSAVYEAKDLLRGRTVALKMLTLRPTEDAERRRDLAERFLREARAISSLSHPNVVAIYEVGQAEDGREFIAMEHMAGETLRARLLRQGALPPHEALPIALQMADALHYAHGRGVIHRDVKPDNVFLQPDGTAKLMDFGVAHVLSDESLTQNGTVVGSPAYMSPEQIGGQALDARTDVFSLGVTLTEMLLGHKPFEAANIPAVMNLILHKAPRLDGLQPRALRKVLARALAKNPSARYASAAEFAEALRRQALPRLAPAEETETVVMDARSLRRRGPGRWRAPLLLALAGVVSFLAAWGLAPRLQRTVWAAHSVRAASRPATAAVSAMALTPQERERLGQHGRVHRISALWRPARRHGHRRVRPAVAGMPTDDIRIQERVSAADPDPFRAPSERTGPQPTRPVATRPQPASAPPVTPVVRLHAVTESHVAPPQAGRFPVQVRVSGFQQERRVALTPAPPAAPAPAAQDAEQSQSVPADDPAPPVQSDLPDSPPHLAQRTAPDYPASAQASGQEGTVRLRVSVNEDGEVTGAEVLQSSGVMALDDAAIACVRHWEYDPAFRDGRAVPGTATARIVFRLD